MIDGDEFIADGVDGADELPDGVPVSGILIEFAQSEVVDLAAEQSGMTMIFENIEVAVFRHMVLQEFEAIPVNGADEHLSESAFEVLSHQIDDAGDDSLLEFRSGLLGECKGDNGSGIGTLVNQRSDATRDGFGLPGPRTSDDLKMPAAMRDDGLLFRRELDRVEGHDTTSYHMTIEEADVRLFAAISRLSVSAGIAI